MAFDNNVAKVQQFIRDNQMEWIQLIQNDTENDIIKKLKISQYPTMILIDPDGKIISRGKEIVEIDKLLTEKLNR